MPAARTAAAQRRYGFEVGLFIDPTRQYAPHHDGVGTALDRHADRAQRVQRGVGVGGVEVVAQRHRLLGHRAKQRRPVRDRLVGGRLELAAQPGGRLEADPPEGWRLNPKRWWGERPRVWRYLDETLGAGGFDEQRASLAAACAAGRTWLASAESHKEGWCLRPRPWRPT